VWSSCEGGRHRVPVLRGGCAARGAAAAPGRGSHDARGDDRGGNGGDRGGHPRLRADERPRPRYSTASRAPGARASRVTRTRRRPPHCTTAGRARSSMASCARGTRARASTRTRGAWTRARATRRTQRRTRRPTPRTRARTERQPTRRDSGLREISSRKTEETHDAPFPPAVVVLLEGAHRALRARASLREAPRRSLERSVAGGVRARLADREVPRSGRSREGAHVRSDAARAIGMRGRRVPSRRRGRCAPHANSAAGASRCRSSRR
jgi:hypothetical protein